MSRNKAVIGVDISVNAQRVLDAENSALTAASELTFIRRRIRTFYTAVTQVSFPQNAPSWAKDWPEWLATGEVTEVAAPPEAIEEELVEVTTEDVAEVPAELLEETLAP